MTPAERVLRDAAAHIERYGWLQHSYGCEGAPCCMAGAIQAVGGTRGRHWALLHYLVVDQVTDFNDYVCKSKADAIAALLIAADLAAEPWEGP